MSDPQMRAREAEQELEPEEGSAAALVERGDVAGLLTMGAARRAEGDEPGAIDCFMAAAELGSADARYLVALAHLTGRGVSADLGEGARHLREAANGGSLRAKVYLANLYELGVHFARDLEKADLWYRNVARSAELESDPSSPEHTREMAALGSVRHCLALVGDASLPAKERTEHLRRAKAMGYALHQRASSRASIASESASPAAERAAMSLEAASETSADATAAETTADTTAESAELARAIADEAAKKARGGDEKSAKKKLVADRDEEPLPEPGSRWTIPEGALAFAVAAFFASSSAAAAWLSSAGVRAFAESGHPLPWIGSRADAAGLAILVALGALPATSVYRLGVVATALVLGGAAGAAGFFGFDSLALAPDRALQAGALFLAAHLLTLLVVGLLGGTRMRPSPKKRKRPVKS